MIYRHDLDGIRAIAILGVLLFHLKFEAFQGGFVGVDVFFVLTGFLITAILEDASGTKIEILKNFYMRRIRRIVPLSMSVLLVTAAVVCSLFDPLQIKSFLPHFIGAVAFLSNVTFWWENSYFSAGLFRPNLHYWSLGVEIQFYLVFPLLALFLRWKKVWFVVLFVLAEAASYWMTSLSAKTAFFLLPFRMGEFIVGSFVYYALRHPFFRQAHKFNDVWVSVGLLAIITSILTFDTNTPFPHVYAMVPVLGTAALILFGGRGSIITFLYDNPLFRHIGKISFSIYLWHFPVIFILTRYFGLDMNWVTGLIVVTITLILSELSFGYIEIPFRRRSNINQQTFTRIAIAAFALTAVLTGAIFLTNGFAYRYPKNVQNVYASMEDRDPYRCGKLARLIEPFTAICTLHAEPNAKAEVLLWGDSHADALKPAFQKEAQKGRFSFYLNKANCSAGDMQRACADNSQILRDIADMGIDNVVLHSSMSGYSPEVQDNLKHIISQLTDMNVTIHVIYPMPIHVLGNPRYILKVLKGDQELPQPDLSIAQYRATIEPFINFKNQIDSAFPNVQFHRVFQVLCPNSHCQFHEDYRVYYFDSHHLTRFGASKFRPLIRTIFPD
jgi:peptidoglycan/LPS O-acetylase OafA/YrhL